MQEPTSTPDEGSDALASGSRLKCAAGRQAFAGERADEQGPASHR